jgi:hypothetical protein
LWLGFYSIESWIRDNWNADASNDFDLSEVIKKTKNDKGEVYKYLEYALRDDIKF